MAQTTISTLQGSPVLCNKFPQPSSDNFRCRKTEMGHRCNRYRMTVCAARRDDDYGGGNGTVDENMIVLRKRIQEMKMMERNQEAPEDWMECEKRYYTHDYNSDVCEAVGLLQTQLMKTRPSVAFGVVALLTLSVPTSMFMVGLRLMEIAKFIFFSGIHPS